MLHNELSPEERAASAKDGAAKLHLPPAPASEQGPVKVWSEPVQMLTYPPAEPDKNPLFLEKRVYQGSSGRVYPLPVTDSVSQVPEMRTWQAIHIENEFLRLMVMPEIGGRIHVGLHKRTGYDFFYRQNVIKPALVGLAGPWISGGVEFNWPQHHRPATFMPVETAIERSPDGSVTVWCSDHDPMARMKGMHGICLSPGKAVVEVKVRLYNRTLDTQTFLWWANVATRVHEKYQSFFPRDVRFAADHAKRAVTQYPLSEGEYYGVNYGERARSGVPATELPPRFIPDGSYPANDLGWYGNIPVPTSYMIVGSRGDFFGGYDHAAQAGTVAVANHHISPGKKQWTWGNHEFGYAWDRNLTDDDGPYIELMSGVYTENQPDFSFLAPGETKSFSQFWYPIASIGVPDLASVDAALRLDTGGDKVCVHLQVTSARPRTTITLLQEGTDVAQWTDDLSPDTPRCYTAARPALPGSFIVAVAQRDRVLLRYAPAEIVPGEEIEAATEPPLPAEVASNDELFLNGLHLEQYRHPTRAAEPYWEEALRRDPGDSRAAHALGRSHVRRGEFARAEELLRTSIARLTRRNPNPSDGEPFYTLGLALLYQGKVDAAYDAFYKSTWNAAWRGPGYLRVAEIDCRRLAWDLALEHLRRALLADADNLNALNLKVVVLRQLGRTQEANDLLRQIRALDPLDITSRFLADKTMCGDAQQQIDLAFDLLRAGLLPEALRALEMPCPSRHDGGSTMRLYLLADVLRGLGRRDEAALVQLEAANADPAYVFPHRLDEMSLLERAMEANSDDARAPYYLGNLLYDRRRYREAISLWERSVALDPGYPTAWRNLAFARFNVQRDASAAAAAFARARELAPSDARIAFEQDQLFRRMNVPLPQRLANLQKVKDLVDKRDDLSVELASLLNSTAKPEQALELLLGRHFGPWEGGEGRVLTEFVRGKILMAQQALAAGNASRAVELLRDVYSPPENLSEARHLLVNFNFVHYWLGVAFAQAGDHARADQEWSRAAEQTRDFQQMQVQAVSESTFWSAMALRALGRDAQAQAAFQAIDAYATALKATTPTIDYFATSLPAMLLFHEDLQYRQKVTATFLHAQAQLGLGQKEHARELLQQVLRLDCSHTSAIDLINSALLEAI